MLIFNSSAGDDYFYTRMKPALLVIPFFIIFLFCTCRKNNFITSGDAVVTLSADTLKFDTVFTSVGSITRFVTIRNDNNRKLLLSRVKLVGGSASPFRINADGTVGPEIANIEIEANDSIYVFVSVSVNPGNSALPFVVQDSIEIVFNGSKRFVQLESWGQNAHFLRGHKITGNVTWRNNLPYVILAGLQVEANATLTIEKGCRIFLHANAPFIVDGTLQVNGGKHDSTKVFFRPDRLDDPYKNYPAGWPGIYFRETSKNNVLNFADIRNAYQGIVAEKPSVNALPKVTLNQCVIDNMFDAGILAIQSSVLAVNCLISNCGKNIQLVYGGDYRFVHCTIAAYSNNYLVHKDPLLTLSNFVRQDNVISTRDIKAGFQNCIFWAGNGVREDEVVTSRQGNNPFAVSFQNCLWKLKTVPADVMISNTINNRDPLFDSLDAQNHFFNFRLKASSPAIDKGIPSGVFSDLEGNPRPVNLPDIGAYEKQ